MGIIYKRLTVPGVIVIFVLSVWCFLYDNLTSDTHTTKPATVLVTSHNGPDVGHQAIDDDIIISSRRRTSLLQPSPGFAVPNVVHYVWFGESEPLKFHHMLSIKSVHKFIKPDQIIFHCDHEPTGSWWNMMRKSVKTLEVRTIRPPSAIFGNEIILPEHQSDVARMQILMQSGGIYLDTDVIVLKSFDPLRRYEFTMGLEYHGQPGRLNNGVIVSTKGSSFLRAWFETYRNFTKREWDYHDSIIPYNLQYEHPFAIHVEEGTINYPSGKQLKLIYNERYDWSPNYAIHLWHSLHQFDHNPRDIRKMNTTFGEIARLVFYGTSKLL